jgi:hypothetical protein
MNDDPISSYTTAPNSRSSLHSRFNRRGCGYATSSRCRDQTAKSKRSHRVDDEGFWSRSRFVDFAPQAEAVLAWEHDYNHERFSMALNGFTTAPKLSRFTAASPLPSVAAPTGSISLLTATMSRPPIARPEPEPASRFSHELNPGATS